VLILIDRDNQTLFFRFESKSPSLSNASDPIRTRDPTSSATQGSRGQTKPDPPDRETLTPTHPPRTSAFLNCPMVGYSRCINCVGNTDELYAHNVAGGVRGGHGVPFLRRAGTMTRWRTGRVMRSGRFSLVAIYGVCSCDQISYQSLISPSESMMVLEDSVQDAIIAYR